MTAIRKPTRVRNDRYKNSLLVQMNAGKDQKLRNLVMKSPHWANHPYLKKLVDGSDNISDPRFWNSSLDPVNLLRASIDPGGSALSCRAMLN